MADRKSGVYLDAWDVRHLLLSIEDRPRGERDQADLDAVVRRVTRALDDLPGARPRPAARARRPAVALPAAPPVYAHAADVPTVLDPPAATGPLAPAAGALDPPPVDCVVVLHDGDRIAEAPVVSSPSRRRGTRPVRAVSWIRACCSAATFCSRAGAAVAAISAVLHAPKSPRRRCRNSRRSPTT